MLSILNLNTDNYSEHIGHQCYGGYFAGFIVISNKTYHLVVSPKLNGDIDNIALAKQPALLDFNASQSDGFKNSFMLGQRFTELRLLTSLEINGYDDWYIPSMDELEVIYRNLKPTVHANSCYFRSGMNLSSVDNEAQKPYSVDQPTQTNALPFRAGGVQALDAEYYWSSTPKQNSEQLMFWCQSFQDGTQNYWAAQEEHSIRLVRKVLFK